MSIAPDKAIKVVIQLTVLAKADGSYRSDAALARAIGIRPQKLSDWRVGRHQVPAEFISFALVLISLGSGAAIKAVLDQRSKILRDIAG